MSFQKIISILLIAAVSQNNAFFISIGSCPESPVLNDFNANKYVGKWYEIERFPTWFERDLSCVSAEYGYVNNTLVTVKNSGTNLAKNTSTVINGMARVPDVTKPNQLLVKFPVNFFGVDLSFVNNEGSYHVWSTDYTKSSLVYSCSKVLFFRLESTWILSRSKTLDQAEVDRLKGLLSAKGVKVSNFQKVAQTCNN